MSVEEVKSKEGWSSFNASTKVVHHSGENRALLQRPSWNVNTVNGSRGIGQNAGCDFIRSIEGTDDIGRIRKGILATVWGSLHEAGLLFSQMKWT